MLFIGGGRCTHSVNIKLLLVCYVQVFRCKELDALQKSAALKHT